MDLTDEIELTDLEPLDQDLTVGIDDELSDIELSAEDVELSETDPCLDDVDEARDGSAKEALFERAGSDLSDPDAKD